MIDDVQLRKQVRVVLSTQRADVTLSEEFILSGLQRFFPTRVLPSHMMLALQWNEARGWVEQRHNADEDRDEWKLTERGRIKEGVS